MKDFAFTDINQKVILIPAFTFSVGWQSGENYALLQYRAQLIYWLI